MTFVVADSLILLWLLCLRVFSVAGFLGVGSVAGCLDRFLLAAKGLNLRSWGWGILEIGEGCLLLRDLLQVLGQL